MLAERGYDVVPEAATDVIARKQGEGVAEPWHDLRFTEWICQVQRQRREAVDSAGTSRVVVFDRSAICTLALSRFLGHPSSRVLEEEISWLTDSDYYWGEALFVQALGQIGHTAARRISYRDGLEFGELHRRSYQEFGFRLIDVPVMPVRERTDYVETLVRRSRPEENS